METKHTFSEYMENSKTLFKMIFGEEEFKKLMAVRLKPIVWQGVDVNDCGITATFPNIKERFEVDWVKYFKERKIKAFDLFLQSVFHYGYQQYADSNKMEIDMNEFFRKMKEVTNKRSDDNNQVTI